jgi:hypothetical protein
MLLFQNCGKSDFGELTEAVEESTVSLPPQQSITGFDAGPTSDDLTSCDLSISSYEIVPGDQVSLHLNPSRPLPSGSQIELVRSIGSQIVRTAVSFDGSMNHAWTHDGTQSGASQLYINVRTANGAQFCRTEAVTSFFNGYTCNLYADKSQIRRGESVSLSYRVSPNRLPSGAVVAWLGSKQKGSSVTLDQPGTTNLPLAQYGPLVANSSDDLSGQYSRVLIFRNSSGGEICRTNPVYYRFLTQAETDAPTSSGTDGGPRGGDGALLNQGGGGGGVLPGGGSGGSSSGGGTGIGGIGPVADSCPATTIQLSCQVYRTYCAGEAPYNRTTHEYTYKTISAPIEKSPAGRVVNTVAIPSPYQVSGLRVGYYCNPMANPMWQPYLPGSWTSCSLSVDERPASGCEGDNYDSGGGG